MASGTGSHSTTTRISPRKFSEKIALLNKKQRATNAEFEKIIKEVQKTRGQPQSTIVDLCPTTNQTQLFTTHSEFQQINDLTTSNYSSGVVASHSDSLEEIERVYENLMKSVGQCDDNEELENEQRCDTQERKCQPMGHHYPNPSGPLKQDTLTMMKFLAENNTSNRISTTIPATNTLYYDPTQQSNEYYHNNNNNNSSCGITNTDLNNNQQFNQNLNNQPFTIPSCEPSLKNNLSRPFTPSNMSLSSTYLPTQLQQQQQQKQENCSTKAEPNNRGRARVVSFGSASRQKYLCTNDYPLSTDQQTSSSLGAHHTQSYQASQSYQTQYLKEPFVDRSRQKSSSDPQLHVSPIQYNISPVNQFKSDNRLAVMGQTTICAPPPPFGQPPNSMDVVTQCCNYNNQCQRSQDNRNTCCTMNHHSDTNLNQSTLTNQNQRHRVLQMSASSSVDCSQNNQVTTTTTSHIRDPPDDGHGYTNPCHPSSSPAGGGELPGIKICAIEDELAFSEVASLANDNAPAVNAGDTSRDSSLPDISNLQFASPERDITYNQKQSWPAASSTVNCMHDDGEMDLTGTTMMTSDSCQALDGSWLPTPDGSTRVESVDMDVQMEQQQQQQQQQMNSNNSTRHSRWLDDMSQQQQQQQQQQQPNKVANVLSSSECGFNTNSNSSHHQQGSLMICTSSDLYNNIFRSRSHGNIDYLAKQNSGGSGGVGAKRLQLCTNDIMPQYEEHHTSQYCLQSGGGGGDISGGCGGTDDGGGPNVRDVGSDLPATVNVRRIGELKAQGTSTSPLNSSSNLNSPQSEMNSPGSSTTEQCESAMLFPSQNIINTTESTFYTANSSNNLTAGSNLTLIPDEAHYHLHYNHTTTTTTTTPMISDSTLQAQHHHIQQSSSDIGLSTTASSTIGPHHHQ